MSKVFVVPDVHLKPWMFEKANEVVSAGTFDAAIAFVRKHPDTWFCYGNHDVSYLWEALHQGNVLTLDNFSTYRDGWAIGNERFVWVDTIKKTWGYV